MPSRRKKLNYKLLSEDFAQWVMFTVMMTLTPIVIGVLMLSFKTNQDPNFAIASFKGELLVASIAIIAEACSDMFKKSSSKNMRLMVGGAAVILLILACTLSTNIQENRMNGQRINDFSIGFFGVSLFIGAGSKILARS